MSYDDLFKPYSPEIKGDLEEYLINRSKGGASNLFFGPKYFFVLKDKKLFIPDFSYIRVCNNFIPDVGYIVNSNFLLKSEGFGESNMSLMGAKKGIYSPKKALKDLLWSAQNLDMNLLFNKQKKS
ncbi:hypothetical protein GW931_02965 [archaeon]|nr:hypothetical protein [archaeon]